MRFYSFLFVCLLLVATIVDAEEDELSLDDDEDTEHLDSTTTKRPKKSTTETPPVDVDVEKENVFPKCRQEDFDGQTNYICQRKIGEKIEEFGIRFLDDGGFYCGNFEDKIGKGFHQFYDDSWYEGYECGDFIDGVKNGWINVQLYESNNITLLTIPDDKLSRPTFSYNPAKNEAQMQWYETESRCLYTVNYDKTGDEKLPHSEKCF